MRNYAVRFAVENALFQLLYLFDLTLYFFTSIRFIWWMPETNDA